MLQREVPNRNPLGSAGAQRLSALKRTAICAFVFTSFVGFSQPGRMTVCGLSKKEDAQLDIKRYVDEAYPLWSRQNPGLTCPARLVDLNPFISRGRDTRDPWGTDYAFSCNGGTPRASSAGEDRRFGTGDDIRSWE